MPPIIDDRRRALPALLAGCSAVAGVAAWWWYHRLGIVLSHYDTKGHLVVARRVFDSLTPGWKQIGAVWLPLPHLLNMLPVQLDPLYRTGLSASALSMASLALAVWAAARLVLRLTGSAAGATVAALALALNPNLLYLGTTPMTEPLLIGLLWLAVAETYDWVQSGADRVPSRLGWVLAAAAWTRYEAWPVIAALTVLAGLAAWRQGHALPGIGRRVWAIALWPAVAAVIFLLNSWITVGAWFVSSGFFVPEPSLLHQPVHDVGLVLWGARALGGVTLTVLGLGGAALLILGGLRARAEAAAWVALAPLAAAALPALAFFQGHPFRIRYAVPLVAALTLTAGFGLGRIRPWPWAAAAIALGLILVEAPPLSPRAPMVLEAQWDRPAAAARQAVSACLGPAYRGELVVASMGSLAHYMQELSGEGLRLSDFISEGTGVIWELAMERGPAAVAGWMLVDEQGEGGDVLAQRIRREPGFAAGMTPICEGGGVTLYRRAARPALARAF